MSVRDGGLRVSDSSKTRSVRLQRPSTKLQQGREVRIIYTLCRCMVVIVTNVFCTLDTYVATGLRLKLRF